MARKNSLTKKEKIYVIAGAALILIILIILGVIAYNNLFGNQKNIEGKIQMTLKDNKIISGEETQLLITITNTGKDLLEGDLIILADDSQAVNVSHKDPSVLNVKLYADESITRVLSVIGTTNAIRTDYKIFAEIQKENKTLTSNELILTVTKE